MTYLLLIDLTESRLFPSRQTLEKWDKMKLAHTAYLYFIILEALVCEDDMQKWASAYCQKAGQPADFDQWRSDSNDLYVLLHALNDQAALAISPAIVRDWLRHPHSHDRMQRLFNRLDAMLHVTDSSLKAIRRLVMHWTENSIRERHDIILKLIPQIKKYAPHSELLTHLQRLEQRTDVTEAATTGGTSAANVATSVGGLGAGFDPDGGWKSIYSPEKRKPTEPSKDKTALIRR